jgi:putative FmdB family regulatory protein
VRVEEEKTMPLYEYECDSCGIRFERTEKMTAEPLKTCPECTGPVHRVIHPVGIIFKGSGFYCTDNRSGSNLASPSTTKEDTGTETKPTSADDKPADNKKE